VPALAFVTIGDGSTASEPFSLDPGCVPQGTTSPQYRSRMAIEPDTKDWTWVLSTPCPECGFDAAAVDLSTLSDTIRANAAEWPALLAAPDAAVRPADDTWSTLEYACHVRDVHRLFEYRLRLMLDHDDPEFPNWDQDETAIAERYHEQDPATVADELVAAAESHAAVWDTVTDEQWQRTGRRDNGSVFTIETFALYMLHDPMHHLADVRR
jgi:hypothetical protein